MTIKKKSFKNLYGVITLDQISLTLTFPLITLIFFDAQSRLFPSSASHATRSMWYGLCVALPNFINIFFAPLLSALSDEFGRKKILLVEVISALLFTLALGLGVYWGILALVFFGFIIKGAFARTNPTALAIIGDMAPREKKIIYMGYLQFAISIGAFIGPIIGGYAAHHFFSTTYNFSPPFFLGTTIAFLNTFFIFFCITETFKKPDNHIWRPKNLMYLLHMFWQKDILRISMMLLLIQLSWSTYYQFISPILKTQYAFSDQQLGWFIGMIAFWLAIATSLGIHLLQEWLTLKQMLLTSVYLILLGFVITLLACAHLLPIKVLWIGAIPIASGDVIAYSCLTALYSNITAQEKQGKIMGISFIIVAFTWAITGVIGGFLMSLMPFLPLMIAPIGVLIAATLLHGATGKKLVVGYE